MWAVQQQEIQRDKRDIFYYDYQERESPVAEQESETEPDAPLNYRLPLVITLDRNRGNEIYYHQGKEQQQHRRKKQPLFNDELWAHEWYLVSN